MRKLFFHCTYLESIYQIYISNVNLVAAANELPLSSTGAMRKNILLSWGKLLVCNIQQLSKFWKKYFRQGAQLKFLVDIWVCIFRYRWFFQLSFEKAKYMFVAENGSDREKQLKNSAICLLTRKIELIILSWKTCVFISKLVKREFIEIFTRYIKEKFCSDSVALSGKDKLMICKLVQLFSNFASPTSAFYLRRRSIRNDKVILFLWVKTITFF